MNHSATKLLTSVYALIMLTQLVTSRETKVFSVWYPGSPKGTNALIVVSASPPGSSFSSSSSSCRFWFGFIPVNGGGWIYPSSNLSNSHSPSCSIHGGRFLQTNALALLFYLRLPHHLWSCAFLLPLTFNIWIGVSSLFHSFVNMFNKLICNFYKMLTALISCLTCSKVLHSSIVRVLVMAAGGAKSLLPSAREELENLDVLKPEADFLIKPVWWGKISNILLDPFCNGVYVNLVWLFLLYNCSPFLQ